MLIENAIAATAVVSIVISHFAQSARSFTASIVCSMVSGWYKYCPCVSTELSSKPLPSVQLIYSALSSSRIGPSSASIALRL